MSKTELLEYNKKLIQDIKYNINLLEINKKALDTSYEKGLINKRNYLRLKRNLAFNLRDRNLLLARVEKCVVGRHFAFIGNTIKRTIKTSDAVVETTLNYCGK